MSGQDSPSEAPDASAQPASDAAAAPSGLANGDVAAPEQIGTNVPVMANHVRLAEYLLHFTSHRWLRLEQSNLPATNGVAAPTEQSTSNLASDSGPPPTTIPLSTITNIQPSQTQSSGQLLASEIESQNPPQTQAPPPVSQPAQAIPPSSATFASTSMAPPPPASSPARNSPIPKVEQGTDPSLPPSVAIPPKLPHGSPTRQYVNNKVTPWLLEGMKWVALNEPEKPLKWLSEYLMKMSKEVEGE
ncbi:MAG: hypothetical protein M1828_004284 [Chrysothrix sp. TS-e1954]|nr:MAG: hypothetical protein M1828_004284 [Chrysothrix sp. TS-e1954]